MNSSKRKLFLADVFTVLSYLLIILLFGGPLLWLLSLSFRTTQQIFVYPPSLIPKPFSWEAYIDIFRGREILLFLKNSTKLSLISSFGTLVVTVPAAYALSRFHFKRKGALMITLLLFQMISPLIIVIPMYRYFNKLGIINSHLGIVMVYIAMLIPFITWILKGFFDSVPMSLEEAAMIDGCSRLRLLFKVVLPIVSSGLFSAFVFSFLLSWSQFIIPMILVDSNKLLPISVGIYLFEAGRTTMSTHVVCAATLLAIVPPIVVFVVLQKYVVQVMTGGAVKG